MSDAILFAQVFELGRMLGWHDGSGRSHHQEYVNAYARRKRRERVVADDEELIRHADLLNRAVFGAVAEGGDLAELVLEQQRDDRPSVGRPRHVIGIEEPAAILAMRRMGRAA